MRHGLLAPHLGYPRICLTVPSIVIMVPGLYMYQAMSVSYTHLDVYKRQLHGLQIGDVVLMYHSCEDYIADLKTVQQMCIRDRPNAMRRRAGRQGTRR